MKRIGTSVAFCAALALVAPAAFAQSTANQSQSGQNNVPAPGQEQMFFRADKLVGRSAQTPVGQNLGTLEEIAFNPEKGIYGIVKAENDRLVPLPWSLVTAVTDKAVVFNTSSQKIKDAPSFTENQWSKLNDPQFTQQLDSHYESAMGGSSAQGARGSSIGAGASPTQQPETSHESQSATDPNASSSTETNSAAGAEPASQDQ